MEKEKKLETLFATWLKAKVSPAQLSELYICYPKIEQVCIEKSIIQSSLFEITGHEKIKQIQQLIATNYIFIFSRKKYIKAMQYYAEFVKGHCCKENESISDMDYTKAISCTHTMPNKALDTQNSTSKKDLPVSQNSESSTKTNFESNNDPLIKLIEMNKIPYSDNRLKGGCLWIFGGSQLQDFVNYLKQNEVIFHFKPDGNKLYPGTPAWWTTSKGYEQVIRNCVSNNVIINREDSFKQDKQESIQFANDRRAFEDWMGRETDSAFKTIQSYAAAIETAEQFAKQKNYPNWHIYDVPKEQALSVVSALLKDKSFISYNKASHNRFSAAFSKLTAFYEGFSKSNSDESVSSKYPQLYDKLFSASKIYDNPAGMSVQRICNIIDSDDNDTVERILKEVSWATEIEDGKFSFSKNAFPVKKEYKPATITDFSKERYIETLLKRYRNGMTFDSIDFDIFREMYKSLFNEEILFNDSELESRLRYCGVIYKDRLFPAEGIIDSETKEKLYSYIETSFASGKKVLYYKAIFEDLSDDFATCYSLADEEMLKAYIAFSAPKNQYFFSKDYLSKEKNVEINHNTEVSDYLLSAGKPIGKDEVCAALSHIPQDRVYQIISFDSRFLRNSKGEYFHTDIFEINESELQKIAEFIEESIKENEYAIWTDIWNRIQKEMPIFLENNLYLSGLGVRNALARRYAGTFDFNGAVISSVGKNYAMRDIYQLFAKHHDTFTAEELYNLSKELDTVIYHEAIAEVSVRVNHDLFVSKNLIRFQVEVIDKCIESFIASDYIRIREIDSFLTFPSVEYEWNEYMLESYLISFSKKYTILNNGMALDNVAGVIVKKGGKISEFVDACAVILADSEVDLKKSTALDYLAKVNVITRRSYREIDNAIKIAKQIRARKG